MIGLSPNHLTLSRYPIGLFASDECFGGNRSRASRVESAAGALERAGITDRESRMCETSRRIREQLTCDSGVTLGLFDSASDSRVSDRDLGFMPTATQE